MEIAEGEPLSREIRSRNHEGFAKWYEEIGSWPELQARSWKLYMDWQLWGIVVES
jgi:hypothetical protein